VIVCIHAIENVNQYGMYFTYVEDVLLFKFVMLLGRSKRVYIHGSVHRESNLIIFQQDATYSVYYISVGSSTCFGC